MKYQISILFLLFFVSNTKAESLNCLFEKIDEGPEVVTFKKEKGFTMLHHFTVEMNFQALVIK